MKEESSSLVGTNNRFDYSSNKSSCDTSRKHQVSIRLGSTLIQKIDRRTENRSKAIRKALRSKYGDSDGY
mgnify:CR=1 FL=1